MKTAAALLSLLVLGGIQTLQGLPVLPDPLYPTKENFDLDKFLGTWHDIAVASSCPHMQKHKDRAIGKLVLEPGNTEGKLQMTRTVLKNGTCKAISGDYELTATPGRFFYHIARWRADADAYVLHTDYEEYAIVIMNKQRSVGEKSTSVKLYSRSMTVRDTIMEDFKSLVRHHGMTDDSITVKLDKGDCVPGEQVIEPPTQPQPQPQRFRRDVVSTFAPLEDGGSGDGGDDTPLFNATVACKAKPETGPCFGLHQRFYYDSNTMSCQQFRYGGCLGNQNNFETERDCLQRCRTEAVCRFPMVPRPCANHPTIWAFDSSNGVCVPYKKDICQANANMFYRKAECEEYCGVVKDDLDLLPPN